MRINYISTYSIPSPRAVGVQITNTCQALSEMGNDVELWISKKEKNFDVGNVYSYYSLKKNFNIGVVYSSKRFNYSVSTLVYLWKLRKKIKPDSVVYSREQLTGLFFKGFVFEVHYLPDKVSFLHKFLWNRASGFVVLTSFLKERLIKEGFDPDKIHIAHDAVSDVHLLSGLLKEESRKRVFLPPGRKIIGYVGKYQTPFSGGKGVKELIEAFNKIKDATLLLVGIDKRYQEEVWEIVRESGLSEDQVIIIGHVTQDKVVEYMRSSDVLIMNYPWSKYAAYQMSPMKLFEYMAAGRPIVASKLPSILEVVGSKEVHLIEPDKKEELVSGIRYILDNSEYADSLARSSKEKVKSYTWANRARGISNFIKNVS